MIEDIIILNSTKCGTRRTKRRNSYILISHCIEKYCKKYYIHPIMSLIDTYLRESLLSFMKSSGVIFQHEIGTSWRLLFVHGQTNWYNNVATQTGRHAPCVLFFISKKVTPKATLFKVIGTVIKFRLLV